MNDLNN